MATAPRERSMWASTGRPVQRRSRAFYRSCRKKLFRGHHCVKCAWCPKKLTIENATVDHIHSLWRGGPDTIDNMTIACRECNLDRNRLELYMRLWFKVRRMERLKQADQLQRQIRKLWKWIIRERPTVYRIAQRLKPN